MSNKTATKSSTKAVSYAFIDSQNLNLGVQKAGWKLDWQKFLHYLQKEHGVERAYLFIGYMPENENLYEQLHELGYLIVLKPTLSMLNTEQTAVDQDTGEGGDNTQKPTVKGNVDAELVLYAMKEMPNYQQAIIVSGDGDFYCLAEYLANKKRLRHVMTPNWQYSSLLKPYEEYIIRIDQLRSKLEHYDRNRKKRKSLTKKRQPKNTKGQ